MVENKSFNINNQCESKWITLSSFRGWKTIKFLGLIFFATINLTAYEAVLSNTTGLSVNTNFTGWTYDYFMQVFVPPADGYINSMDFNFSDLPDYPGAGLSVWIYDANYPWDEIDTEQIADEAPQSHLGYYDAGTALYPIGDNWVFGGINSVEGALPHYAYDPLGEQIWPAFGSGSMSIEPDSSDEGWIHLDLIDGIMLPFPISENEPFIVVVRFNGFPDEGTDDEAYRMGFNSAPHHVDPQPCAKFYNTISSPEGRSGTNDWGWHIRSYVWDWAINVELVSSPQITIIMESLGTTVSTEDRTVTTVLYDDSPSGQATIDSVSLWYVVDGGASNSVPMMGEDSLYSGVIPGQEPGSVIQYWVVATDISGETYESSSHSYSIFQPNHPTLVVFNGGDTSGYPYEDYFGPAEFPHDVWNEEILPELAAEYTTIYEIAHYGNGPAFDNRAVIAAWLETGEKNYCLAGDEQFGRWTNWTDQDYEPGDFEYDVLGVSHIYNDISVSPAAVTPIEAVPGNILTDSLYIAHMAAGDTLMYDPVYVVGGLNWLDGFDLVDPGSANMVTLSDGMPIGLNRRLGDDKIVVLGFDPISINASPYQWYGNSAYSPLTNSVTWFMEPNSVDDVCVPERTSLSAAYPNPFNPSTSIDYQLSNPSDVSISVFNMLGQEVASLVTGFQTAGTYTVSWNGLDTSGKSVPSGLYFYKMQVEGFSATQKMMLLK